MAVHQIQRLAEIQEPVTTFQGRIVNDQAGIRLNSAASSPVERPLQIKDNWNRLKKRFLYIEVRRGESVDINRPVPGIQVERHGPACEPEKEFSPVRADNTLEVLGSAFEITNTPGVLQLYCQPHPRHRATHLGEVSRHCYPFITVLNWCNL